MGMAFLDSASWRRLWRQPLVVMLLLSLALHAAVVVLVQPRIYPGSQYVDTVIDARLVPDQRAALPPSSPSQTVPQDSAGHAEAALAEARTNKVTAEVAAAKAPEPSPVAKPVLQGDTTRPAAPPSAAGKAALLPSIPVMADATWYEAKQLDVQPTPSVPFERLIVFPPEAMSRNIRGSVTLRLKIDEFGIVQEATILESNPPGVYDEAVLAAVKKERFVPAQRNGLPVRSIIKGRLDLTP